MVDLTELYPSVFRMIRAEAKAFGKQIRFQKEVHIRICQKIQNAIESFIRNALKSSKGKLLPTHFLAGTCQPFPSRSPPPYPPGTDTLLY